jgi:deoxycytidylate deaminase
MISLAFKQASRSRCKARHGAVVSKGKRVFGQGHNTYKTHPTFGSGPLNTLHAEAAAIRDATNKGCSLHGATIYVVRDNTNNMSKPCKHCQKLIKSHGIRKVCYTNREGDIEEWTF